MDGGVDEGRPLAASEKIDERKAEGLKQDVDGGSITTSTVEGEPLCKAKTPPQFSVHALRLAVVAIVTFTWAFAVLLGWHHVQRFHLDALKRKEQSPQDSWTESAMLWIGLALLACSALAFFLAERRQIGDDRHYQAYLRQQRQLTTVVAAKAKFLRRRQRQRNAWTQTDKPRSVKDL